MMSFTGKGSGRARGGGAEERVAGPADFNAEHRAQPGCRRRAEQLRPQPDIERLRPGKRGADDSDRVGVELNA